MFNIAVLSFICSNFTLEGKFPDVYDHVITAGILAIHVILAFSPGERLSSLSDTQGVIKGSGGSVNVGDIVGDNMGDNELDDIIVPLANVFDEAVEGFVVTIPLSDGDSDILGASKGLMETD